MKLFVVLSVTVVALYLGLGGLMWLADTSDPAGAFSSAATVMGMLIGGTVGLVLYFAPTFVATQREHASRDGIVVLNVLLGWTVLGWIIALVWAASGQHATSAS